MVISMARTISLLKLNHERILTSEAVYIIAYIIYYIIKRNFPFLVRNELLNNIGNNSQIKFFLFFFRWKVNSQHIKYLTINIKHKISKENIKNKLYNLVLATVFQHYTKKSTKFKKAQGPNIYLTQGITRLKLTMLVPPNRIMGTFLVGR